MGDSTSIQWCDATFNPWWGCTKVSPGCEHCYAETLAVTRRQLPVWGPAPRFGRKMMSEGYWKGPEKWQRKAEREGIRYRVFCASMADVFDEHPAVVQPRERLWALIEATPSLDWQLLTKRPGNVLTMIPAAWRSGLPRNVWVGTSVENQTRAEERIPILLRIPAAVRFLSCEPLIGPVVLRRGWIHAGFPDHIVRDERGTRAVRPRLGIHWVIAGGESGPGARPCNVAWIRSLVEQGRANGLPAFVKQLGANIRDRNDAGFDAFAEVYTATGLPTFPGAWPEPVDVEYDPNGFSEAYQGAPVRVRLSDRKGGDPSEWPMNLRVREFPEVRRG